MNTSQTISHKPAQLSPEVLQMEKMHQQIVADMEALRVQEANLRAYETRLRDTPPPVAAVRQSRPPITSESVEAEWEKVRRSRTLLDAERRAFVDERAQLREQQSGIKQREEAVRQREAWLVLRERDLAAKEFAPPPPTPTASPRSSFTRAPFAAAKQLLSFRSAS